MHGHDTWLTCHLDLPRPGEDRHPDRTRHLAEATRRNRSTRREARDRKQAARLRRRAERLLRHAGVLERRLRLSAP
ncbi:hypothetical protein [Microlunatus speluncae]|uniref:hypothetical protein n=1 Tax=Microlunatus speluncae TaxID=2594267 RepID=UPI00126620D3|nr:hypothetical protein [Microlunatus speluncae]